MTATIIVPITYQFKPKALREAMKAQGVSQKQLAEERGCHYVTISRVLGGTNQSPEIVRWLCERLGVPESSVMIPPGLN